MDIGNGKGYPSDALSNFAPHPFIIDSIECASMKGFLQSLKFSSSDMQREVCKVSKTQLMMNVIHYMNMKLKKEKGDYYA